MPVRPISKSGRKWRKNFGVSTSPSNAGGRMWID